MPTKEDLLKKLQAKPCAKNFTIKDLDSLMRKCDCTKTPAGRGSGVKYTNGQRCLIFDLPHPGKDLYRYQIKMLIKFLISIGEIEDGGNKNEFNNEI